MRTESNRAYYEANKPNIKRKKAEAERRRVLVTLHRQGEVFNNVHPTSPNTTESVARGLPWGLQTVRRILQHLETFGHIRSTRCGHELRWSRA